MKKTKVLHLVKVSTASCDGCHFHAPYGPQSSWECPEWGAGNIGTFKCEEHPNGEYRKGNFQYHVKRIKTADDAGLGALLERVERLEQMAAKPCGCSCGNQAKGR